MPESNTKKGFSLCRTAVKYIQKNGDALLFCIFRKSIYLKVDFSDAPIKNKGNMTKSHYPLLIRHSKKRCYFLSGMGGQYYFFSDGLIFF